MKLAVVLGNLGGPDGPEAVRPFLYNLFNDPAIIGLPQPFRSILARLIARRREPFAAEIYARMGGCSPLLEETMAQTYALEAALCLVLPAGYEARVFSAMRYWHPLVDSAVASVKDWAPDQVLLLPLYPQYSGTTAGSFFAAWNKMSTKHQLNVDTSYICCFPTEPRFIEAHAALIREKLGQLPGTGKTRLLFSAHGLPKHIAARGDPYAWQVEQTAKAIMGALNQPGLDWRVCYQSRVGPLPWLEPYTEAEIRQAGADGFNLVVIPVAFVSEHAETLVELDQDYAALAAASGVKRYLRVPALGIHPQFIEALAMLVLDTKAKTGMVSAAGTRICPAECRVCPLSFPNSSVT